MTVQCRVCKRIRVNGKYRLPWPGELSREVAETYCPRCAADTLERIQSGELARSATRRLRQRATHAHLSSCTAALSVPTTGAPLGGAPVPFQSNRQPRERGVTPPTARSAPSRRRRA